MQEAFQNVETIGQRNMRKREHNPRAAPLAVLEKTEFRQALTHRTVG